MSNLQAINISAQDAYSIEQLPPNFVFISINNEDSLFPLKLDRNDERILTVQFSDVICDCERAGQKLHTLSPELGTKIVGFIKKNKDCSFLVSCHAGVSRSSAVALFISLKYGHKLKENFWLISNPNTNVLGVLVRESEREGVLCF